ncbi:hypothetical protein GCM10011487_68290 [Steroidobacter agaridevorans]|uniref:SLH domain-containing protein n=1 Tax=Steroidobacter agaridevorans TaxID=2695856 RepID=A0A829YNV1_9GAMM|nr:hypothetical protein [Steroidobacter agaridevorans]GFE84829.1 hypothetical protein GCM10011487_68290 [Steroidobacter agaridevorans]
MKIRKQILAGAVASSMIGLAACGGGSKGTQDVGTNPSGDGGASSRVFHARAIDGYLAGATVYVDQNANGKLDAFEPRALTDSDGYFSYNHRTGTDYCAAGGLTQFCLRGGIAADAEVVIRVTGGYDTITQLPFEGMLSLRSSDLDRDDLRLVTPQTSMVADAGSATQAKLDALIKAGILDSTGLNSDPFDNAGQMTRAQAAVIISQVFGTVAELSLPAATFEDIESSVWANSYIAMSAQLIEGIDTGSGIFQSTFGSAEALEELARRAIFTAVNPGEIMPGSYQLPNPALIQPLLQNTADIIALNEELLAALNGWATPEELAAILRLQRIAAERALQNPNDPELPDLYDWARAQITPGGLGTDLTGLGMSDIDVAKLVDRQFDFDPISNSISASATIPAEAATAFAALVNTAFSVSLDKPDEQGDALLFVTGANGARSGEIKVCVRYRGDDGDFDTTSSSDPNGALLVGGHWSLLDDHTLTLSLNIAGGARSMLLKAVGTNATGLDYRFDFGDDLENWSGLAPAGFSAGSVPTSDATCKASLLERFGQM